METQDGAPYEFLIEVVDRVADGYRLRVAFPDLFDVEGEL